MVTEINEESSEWENQTLQECENMQAREKNKVAKHKKESSIYDDGYIVQH